MHQGFWIVYIPSIHKILIKMTFIIKAKGPKTQMSGLLNTVLNRNVQIASVDHILLIITWEKNCKIKGYMKRCNGKSG